VPSRIFLRQVRDPDVCAGLLSVFLLQFLEAFVWPIVSLGEVLVERVERSFELDALAYGVLCSAFVSCEENDDSFVADADCCLVANRKGASAGVDAEGVLGDDELFACDPILEVFVFFGIVFVEGCSKDCDRAAAVVECSRVSERVAAFCEAADDGVFFVKEPVYHIRCCINVFLFVELACSDDGYAFLGVEQVGVSLCVEDGCCSGYLS